jgi:hypothetical protein
VLKEHSRAARAHYAAIEAAEDDLSFSPDAIENSVAQIVELAGDLWRGMEVEALDDRPDAGLIRAWARSCQSRFGDGLEAAGKPTIDLLSVVNRPGEEEDRVVLRVRLRIHTEQAIFGTLRGHHVHLDERWTLGRMDHRWLLLSVSGDPLAGPVLASPLIPNPSSDSERLREESLVELAVMQKVGDNVDLSELISADDPPAFALLDLSVVDSRFGPALLAAELKHLLDAWEDAVNGPEAPLEDLTDVDARSALLRPRLGERLVMRDAVLKSWEATRLDLSHQKATIEVALDVEAVRYVVTDDGKVVAGNYSDPHRMELRWNLELTDSTRTPWRLVNTNNPAAAIPGWP